MSHRLRLALFAGALAGAALAAIFGAVLAGARRVALDQVRFELSEAFNNIPRAPGRPFDLGEFRRLHPSFDAAVYGADGALRRGEIRKADPVTLERRVAGERVVLAESWEPRERELERLALVLAALWLPLVGLFGGATWVAANAIFRPLASLGENASEISGRDLSARLDTGDRAEFGQFARRLNAMLDRMETSARREEQFARDAAHELRTPLAIARTRIETTLLRERPPETYRTALEDLLGELGRVTRVTEALLRSARGEATPPTDFDAAEVVEGVLARWAERAPDSPVAARVEPVTVRMVPHEVELVLDNLLDNARRYSPPGEPIRVALTGEGVLTVHDRGPGIPAPLMPRVFERLTRGEDDRNRASGGAGLGLALCRRVLQARGGAIAVTNDGGARFEVRLPVAGDG